MNAQVHARGSDPFFLEEEFVGRLVAWFGNEVVAIMLQFVPDERPEAGRSHSFERRVVAPTALGARSAPLVAGS